MSEDEDKEARAFQKAREVIAEYGDDVAAYLQVTIDTLIAEREYELLVQWFAIRNAVAITLRNNSTDH